jgi:signal transduction histidine kinase
MIARAKITLPTPTRSLSARLLFLTIAFIMLAEVLIFTPSVGRYRLSYLEDRLAAAHLSLLALEATPDQMVSEALEAELLSHVGAYSVALRSANAEQKLMLMIDMPPPVDVSFDLTEAGFFPLIREALVTLVESDNRVLRVSGLARQDPMLTVEVVMDEAPLRLELINFGYRILALSLLISLFTAALVFLSLHLLLVRPMRRIGENMVSYRENPEDASRIIVPSGRGDEIGLVEHQLQEMQGALRASLHQKTRLAAVGVSVTKINHDLRNILSTAQLVSDRLANSDDPEVRRTAATLFGAIDRAIKLCVQTLNFTREGPAVLDLSEFGLAELIDEVGRELPVPVSGEAVWVNEVPGDLRIEGDHEQLYRVFHNLGLNAIQAGASHVTISANRENGELAIEFSDDGPGLAPRARQQLFRPFASSTRIGGTGLGLTIARELIRAHGGEIRLVRSNAHGSCFRLSLPSSQAQRRAAE